MAIRVVGIDYASRGYSGLALAVNGQPKSASTFISEARKDESDPTMLAEYERWLTFKLTILRPDIVAVVKLAVFQNKNVIRALSHREAVALLVARKKAAIVVNYTDTQARSVVFKDGSISKDDAWKVRGKFIDFEFGIKNKGGLDKMDAMTQALAATVLMERGA